MKRTFPSIVAALILAFPAYAVDEHHPEGQRAAGHAAEKTVEKMQENTTKLQMQLDRIAGATDPQERQRLMMEHMQTMRENMMLGQQMAMGDMNCPMMDMMGGGMGMMMGPGSNMGGSMHESMVQRMEQMERRMDMMERQIGSQPKRSAP